MRQTCWWCNKKFMRITTGPRAGMVSFAERIVNGTKVKIHQSCIEEFDHEARSACQIKTPPIYTPSGSQ